MVKYQNPYQRVPDQAKLDRIMSGLKKGMTDKQYSAYIRGKQPPLTPSKQELKNYNYWGSDDDRLAIEEIEGSSEWAAKDLAFKRTKPNWWDDDGVRAFEPGSADHIAQQAYLGKQNATPTIAPTIDEVTAQVMPQTDVASVPEQSQMSPALRAPAPGKRNFLFGLKNQPNNMNQNSYMATAFGQPAQGSMAPQIAQAMQQIPKPALPFNFNQQMMQNSAPVAMPQSNLDRFNAIAAGGPRTHYAELVDQRAAEIQKMLVAQRSKQKAIGPDRRKQPTAIDDPYRNAYGSSLSNFSGLSGGTGSSYARFHGK